MNLQSEVAVKKKKDIIILAYINISIVFKGGK